MILAFIGFFTVYAICFGIGLVFAVISAVTAGVFGGDHGMDHHVDTGGADHGVDAAGGHEAAPDATGGHMPEFSPISPVTIFTFITCFGGAGMIFSRIDATNHAFIHLPLSLLAGFGGAAVVFAIFSKVFSATQSSSEARVAGLIGQGATVVTPIPENGVGEIVYVVGGSRYNSHAREESGQPVPTGAEVKITRVVSGSFYVKKV
jgi:membrane protein implicated in regulation of membrane protease activity